MLHVRRIMQLLKTHEYEIVESEIAKFVSQYPESAFIDGLRVIEGNVKRHAHRFAEASAAYQAIQSPVYREIVQLTNGFFIFKEGQWQESREELMKFLDAYPSSRYVSLAQEYIARASWKMVDENPESDFHREQLIHDLKDIEKPIYKLKQGQTLYELKRYPEAVEHLNTFISQYPDDPNLYQAHLILAMCYHVGFQNILLFSLHGEKALDLNPDFSGHDRLHLNLFNSYMKMVLEVGHIKSVEPIVEKAAEHLYKTAIETDVREEQLLWLANHYYDKLKAHYDEYITEPIRDLSHIEIAERARTIFDKAAPLSEKELLKISNLHGWLNEEAQQIAMLESLDARPQVLLALGYAYEKQNQRDEAIRAYERIRHPIAKLHLARLKYQRLSEEEKTLENTVVLTILNDLKELQLHNHEAALDYAQIRASLEPEDTKERHLLKLLKNGRKECFTYDEIVSEHTQQYLMLFDAHIARLEAKEALSRDSVQEGMQKKETAKLLYRHLIYGDIAVSKYVEKQAKLGLQEL